MLSKKTVVINPELNSEKYNKPLSQDLVTTGKVNRNELLDKLSSLFSEEFLEEVKFHDQKVDAIFRKIHL